MKKREKKSPDGRAHVDDYIVFILVHYLPYFFIYAVNGLFSFLSNVMTLSMSGCPHRVEQYFY